LFADTHLLSSGIPFGESLYPRRFSGAFPVKINSQLFKSMLYGGTKEAKAKACWKDISYCLIKIQYVLQISNFHQNRNKNKTVVKNIEGCCRLTYMVYMV